MQALDWARGLRALARAFDLCLVEDRRLWSKLEGCGFPGCVVYATPAQSGWATRPKTAWRSPHAGLAGAGLPRRNPLPCSFVLDRSDGARTVLVSDCHRTEGTQPAPLLPADQLPTTDGDADDDDVRPSPRRLPPSPVHLPSTFIFGVMAFVAAASVSLSSAATTARATCQYVVFSSLLFL